MIHDVKSDAYIHHGNIHAAIPHLAQIQNRILKIEDRALVFDKITDSYIMLEFINKIQE